ncbi:MAG: hypothetical protein KAH25_01580 [Bacteroidales bacterium]|nr:hypothetical protein [Bacteroidales bacterium]
MIFALSIVSSFAQNDTDETSDLSKSFLNKKNQHSLSLEAIALSYTYVHQFKPKLNFGFRIQAGLGFKLALKQHHFFELMHAYDVIKLQLIYRFPLTKGLYFDVGPMATVGSDGESGVISYGLQLSTFYRIKRVHIGMRIESTSFYINTSHNYIGISLIPIVLGFNF